MLYKNRNVLNLTKLGGQKHQTAAESSRSPGPALVTSSTYWCTTAHSPADDIICPHVLVQDISVTHVACSIHVHALQVQLLHLVG